ncbi:MAG: LD-carboxypeptidase, partial [Pseudoflavonifractor sp.]
FAADDAQRAADLNCAFLDSGIDGIFCLRGGYGAARLLPLLDLDAIAAHPKWFGGYSDVTALHTAFNQSCGFVTCHCTMPSAWSRAPLDPLSTGWLRRALFDGLRGPLDLGSTRETLVPGVAEGRLCGGNLSLLAASLGTPWALDARGKLLFLEDIGEHNYRIDAMLTQLRNGGIFRDCAGILLGQWTDITPENPLRSLSLGEIFEELLVPAGKPLLTGLPCGHGLPTMALPLGAYARMDAASGTLEVL